MVTSRLWGARVARTCLMSDGRAEGPTSRFLSGLLLVHPLRSSRCGERSGPGQPGLTPCPQAVCLRTGP